MCLFHQTHLALSIFLEQDALFLTTPSLTLDLILFLDDEDGFCPRAKVRIGQKQVGDEGGLLVHEGCENEFHNECVASCGVEIGIDGGHG